mgnify:CR=1 FL=1
MNNPLRITMVVDTYGITTNGTTITAMRSVEALRKRGHTVNVITGSPSDDEFTFTTGYSKMPILYQISKSQGMFIAKNNSKILKEVIKESDIVHFLLPFKIQKSGLKISEKLNVPSSAAFHLQPENITSTLYLNKFDSINDYIYNYFKKYYNKFSHIHCPSNMIANLLKEHGYNAKLHVISNGVDPKFTKRETNKPDHLKDKFIILMIGRLSREKRQDIIINAVKSLSFEKDVQIILAGKGPWKKTLIEESLALSNPPIMDFYSQDELIDIINYSDIYVHASDAEIEAISCIEAFSCGLVPIIGDSKISATNQFSLTDHNIFKAADSSDLAKKITHLYNNPEMVKDLSEQYIKYSEQFQLEACVTSLEKMFYEAINDFNQPND